MVGGSGVEVLVALVAPGDREVDDEVRGDEAEPVARRWRPGSSAPP